MDRIKQVFSPGKAQDDEVMYGTPSSKEGAASDAGTTQAAPTSTLQTEPEAEQKDKGVFRQIFNPGGEKYSEQSYGTTATAQPSMADQLQKEPASSEPLKGAETAQINDDKVVQLGGGSNTTGTTSMGPSTMAREDRQDDVSNATFTARSYALGSGNAADPRQTSSNVDEATRATTGLGPSGDDLPREHHGRRLDNSLAGAATGGAGAGYVDPNELQEFMKHGRDPEADQATYTGREQYLGSSSDANPFQRPGHELYSADKGPAGLSTAGEEAPGHVPGEFPADDGSDPHSSSSGIGTGAGTAAGLGAGAGAGAAGIAASKAYNDRNTPNPSEQTTTSGYDANQPSSPITTTTNTMRSGSFSNSSQPSTSGTRPEDKKESGGFRGALAAATTAMGLGGAGAYAASRDDKNEPTTARAAEPTSTSQTSRSVEPSSTNAGSVVSDSTQSYHHARPGNESSNVTSSTTPTSASRTQEPEREDHTARNAALGAGAVGAGGAAAYGLSQNWDRDEPQSVVSNTTQRYHGSRPSDNTSGAPSSQSQGYTGSQPADRSAAYSSPTIASTTESQPRSTGREDHTARNAALGAGGAGAAGAGAAYALGSRENDNTTSNVGDVASPQSSSTGYGPSSTGSNSGNAQSVVSPETQKYHRHHPGDSDSNLKAAPTSGTPSLPTRSAEPATGNQAQRSEEDHTARNAALGTGALAGAGAGAYALSNRDNDNTRSVVSDETQKYAGSHPSDNTSTYQASQTAPTSSSQPTSRSYEPSTTMGSASQPQSSNQNQQPTEEDHTARNAALGAGGLGAAGAAGYGLSNRDNDNTGNIADPTSSNTGNVQSVVSPETQAYRGHHPSDRDSSLQSSGMAGQTQSTGNSQQPAGYAQEPRGDDHTARNAALGAGAAGTAGAAAYGLSNRDNDTGNAESVVSPETQRFAGQHPSDSDPTYRGASSRPSDSTAAPASGSRTAGPIPSDMPIASSEYDRSAQPQRDDHTARNTALGAGGLGAAAGGAYALGQDDKTRYDPNASSQPAASSTNYSRPSAGLDDSAMESSVLGAGPATTSTQAQPRSEDHTARNTALGAGGVGAAGAGAYAMGRGGDDTGPATRTTGPHESNAANVMDPRNKPDFTQQYDRTTAGPYQSNVANKMDPRVTSDAVRAQEQDQGHHYGRDAAMVGGAGAAGAAGYGAYQYANRDEPTQQYGQQYAQPEQVQRQTAAPVQEKYKEPKEHHHREKEPKPEKEHHHREKEPKHEKDVRQEERDPRVLAGADGHNKLHKKNVDPEEDHTGRNAALGAGGVAGAGAAGYGAKEYYDNKSDTQGTTGSQEGEKKHGFMHKILHPREHKREEEEQRRSADMRRSYEQPQQSTATTGEGYGPNVVTGVHGSELEYGGKPHAPAGQTTMEPQTGTAPGVGSGQGYDSSNVGAGQGQGYGSNVVTGVHGTQLDYGGMPHGPGEHPSGGQRVTEPHTGLPMDLSKGTGVGGTDGGPIEGYHQPRTEGGDVHGGSVARGDVKY